MTESAHTEMSVRGRHFWQAPDQTPYQCECCKEPSHCCSCLFSSDVKQVGKGRQRIPPLQQYSRIQLQPQTRPTADLWPSAAICTGLYNDTGRQKANCNKYPGPAPNNQKDRYGCCCIHANYKLLPLGQSAIRFPIYVCPPVPHLHTAACHHTPVAAHR